jgi:16S rRNA (cytosine967-C5)-methyltransferase
VPPANSPSPIALSHLLQHTADMVQGVREGRSLTDLLARVPPTVRAGTQALSFAVLRRLGGAQAVRSVVAPKVPPPAVDALLVSAIALLWPPAPGERTAYADHTLVDQAVHAAHHRTPAAAAFINAVLRRFVRERETLVAAAEHQPEGAFNHPLWWIERLRHDWPAHWQGLMREANRHPPMTLRVNARRGTAANYVQRLAAQGQAAQATGSHSVVLGQPCPVTQLPGFAEGEVSVQDAAAQLAAPLLLGERAPGADAGPGRLPPRARLLDACAAPGGKSAHLLELADLDLLALDSDPQRLVKVQDNLTRLHLSAALKSGDACHPAAWWDGRPFDAILVDAPCSASGIVRRHPDIRWLRRPDDVTALVRIQAQMLDALWPLLATGGRLLYATCSVFKAEGQQQIDAFLQRLGPGAARLDPGSPGHLLPLPDNVHAAAATADAFYYALIYKP